MTTEPPQRRKSDTIFPKADLSDPSLHTAKELRRTLRILIALTLVLYVILGIVAVETYFQGKKNTRALCTIRANAEDRVAQTQAFLIKHPHGVAGISIVDLSRSLQASQATVRALDDVNCN